MSILLVAKVYFSEKTFGTKTQIYGKSVKINTQMHKHAETQTH
jgi:hypothetical protein